MNGVELANDLSAEGCLLGVAPCRGVVALNGVELLFALARVRLTKFAASPLVSALPP